MYDIHDDETICAFQELLKSPHNCSEEWNTITLIRNLNDDDKISIRKIINASIDLISELNDRSFVERLEQVDAIIFPFKNVLQLRISETSIRFYVELIGDHLRIKS